MRSINRHSESYLNDDEKGLLSDYQQIEEELLKNEELHISDKQSTFNKVYIHSIKNM